MKILDWKECINTYDASFFNFWYDISISYDKKTEYRRWWIRIRYERDNITYDYSFYSPMSEEEKEKFSEIFVTKFNPDEVPHINEKYELNTYYDWWKIKSLESNKEFVLDGKYYKYIREHKQIYRETFNLIINKKIKLKKISVEELIQEWVKERENNNLYVPQIENLFWEFEELEKARIKAENIIDYNKREFALDIIDKDVSKVVWGALQSIYNGDYTLKQIQPNKEDTRSVMLKEMYEEDKEDTIEITEEKKETKKKKFDWSVIWNVFVLIFNWIFSVIWFIFNAILNDSKKSKKKK